MQLSASAVLQPALAAAVPANMAMMRRCCVFLLLLLHCSGLPQESVGRMPLQAERRLKRRELPSRRTVPQVLPTASHSRPAAPDIQLEELLASCGFHAADMPGDHPKRHTPSSACGILGKFDGLVLVGDSLTRQVLTSSQGNGCLGYGAGQHLQWWCITFC